MVLHEVRTHSGLLSSCSGSAAGSFFLTSAMVSGHADADGLCVCVCVCVRVRAHPNHAFPEMPPEQNIRESVYKIVSKEAIPASSCFERLGEHCLKVLQALQGPR